ncbi:MAG: ATP-binding protein [Prolixibacteraceae bacterium]|nr:ATP-binding protein [Prolixibacteraceae bacterium]
MVLREKYLNRIIPFIDKPLIKTITGVRRCGKSTLLRQIENFLIKQGIGKSRIISINKELFEFDAIRNYKDLHQYISSKAKRSKEKYYLFIDEVQEIEQWEKAVNSFLAEEKFDIFISGSNARMLSSDLATLITGRYIEFRMYPFTFSEFREIYTTKKNNEVNDDIFGQFIKYGGFPGLHNLVWEEEILRQYLVSLYSTVVLKDVVIRNQIKNVSMLNHILDFVASNCGNITTAKSIRDFSKSQGRNITVDTVLNYLQYTLDAFLIHKTKRFDLIGKRLLETYEKYFLVDTGLAFAMIGHSPALISGQLENVVLIELLSRGYVVNVGKNKEKEIDFIASKGNEKIYIQVCSTLTGNENVYKREYNAFQGLDDNFPKFVLSLDEAGFTTSKNGIKWINLKKFLLDK